MKTKLTLSIDKDKIKEIKKSAIDLGTTCSNLFVELFDQKEIIVTRGGDEVISITKIPADKFFEE